MDFSSTEQFELHVHKCFGKIFELLQRMDVVVKSAADKAEAAGEYGPMSDLRDDMEEVILHCHLAWQYHRLSKAMGSRNTWDVVEKKDKED